MPSTEDSKNKLIMLFVFDKMEDSLTEQTLVDICSYSNDWIPYMDCTTTLDKLAADNFISCISEEDSMYSLTTDGRETLANFYVQIPKSLREEISIFIKKNSARYRNKQECKSDYYQNKDGTYTVYLKILSRVQPILELKFVVADKKTAAKIHLKWEDKAADVYSSLYENLVD